MDNEPALPDTCTNDQCKADVLRLQFLLLKLPNAHYNAKQLASSEVSTILHSIVSSKKETDEFSVPVKHSKLYADAYSIWVHESRHQFCKALMEHLQGVSDVATMMSSMSLYGVCDQVGKQILGKLENLQLQSLQDLPTVDEKFQTELKACISSFKNKISVESLKENIEAQIRSNILDCEVFPTIFHHVIQCLTELERYMFVHGAARKYTDVHHYNLFSSLLSCTYKTLHERLVNHVFELAADNKIHNAFTSVVRLIDTHNIHIKQRISEEERRYQIKSLYQKLCEKAGSEDGQGLRNNLTDYNEVCTELNITDRSECPNTKSSGGGTE